jgi:2-dehydropantoate 2-reductase
MRPKNQDTLQKEMKIAILGPGTMGSLFGGLLARAGEEVVLLDYRPERARQIAASGISLKTAEGEFTIPVKAAADPTAIGAADLLLVCVKAFQTAAAAKWAAPCAGEQTSVLTLQNGLGNLEALSAAFGPSHVIGGTTGHGAILESVGRVIHSGTGETIIGEQSGEITPRLQKIKSLLDKAGIPATITTNLNGAIWGKMVINCAINPLAALTRLRNGDLLKEPALANLLAQVAVEAAQVASASGIELPYPDPAEQTKKVCLQTAENINSMLADVLSHRPTEISEINGAVVRTAEAVGLRAGLNGALTSLIRGIEEGYSRQVD